MRWRLVILAFVACASPALAIEGAVDLWVDPDSAQVNGYTYASGWDVYTAMCQYGWGCAEPPEGQEWGATLSMSLYRNGAFVSSWSDPAIANYGSATGWIQYQAPQPSTSATYNAYGAHGVRFSICGEGNPGCGFQSVVLASSSDYGQYVDPLTPVISQFDPDHGIVNQDGYVVVKGNYLDDAVVSLNGQALSNVYTSSTQINAYYTSQQAGSVGTKVVEVSNEHGTAEGYFDIVQGDQTPEIQSVSPTDWPAGQRTYFSIEGLNFGARPGIEITCSGAPCRGVTGYGVDGWSSWDRHISAWVDVDVSAPDQQVELKAISTGLWGNGFAQVPGQQSVPNSEASYARVKGLQLCPHPINYRVDTAFNEGTNGVLVFKYLWDSSDGNLAHLSGCWLGERVTYSTSIDPYYLPSPPFALPSTYQGFANPTTGPNLEVPGEQGYSYDTHSTPSNFVTPFPIGVTEDVAHQYYYYRCSCIANQVQVYPEPGTVSIIRRVNAGSATAGIFTIEKSGRVSSRSIP